MLNLCLLTHSSVCILNILWKTVMRSCLPPSGVCWWEWGWRLVNYLLCSPDWEERPESQEDVCSCHILTIMCPLTILHVLSFLTRHSPKVVKAASQVLNSMWQYRDLRSLYKKVRFALPSRLMSETQALSQRTLYLVLTQCILDVEITCLSNGSNWKGRTDDKAQETSHQVSPGRTPRPRNFLDWTNLHS